MPIEEISDHVARLTRAKQNWAKARGAAVMLGMHARSHSGRHSPDGERKKEK